MNDGKKGDKTSEVAIKLRDVMSENLSLKAERDEIKTKFDVMKKERDDLKEVVSEDIRARKVNRIQGLSNFTLEDLDSASLIELDTIESTLKMARKEYTPVADQGVGSTKTSLDSLYENTPWGKEGR